ncbi:Major facilitator superfamily domain general substrate transporter [Penicillium fimorum]|uniref:Major facilitator superfamily domain general substrate transporter n=1 Tax=Penicillium fimorum TaxID=1882269 RepID=A0A9W9XJB5_9EURO|nr:Major facilitator superfamily domain general substrate transporter [Penicillium fimorum]
MAFTHDAEKGPHPVLPEGNSLGDRPSMPDPDPDPDPNEVFWDDDADPSNPMNWSAMYLWFHVGFKLSSRPQKTADLNQAEYMHGTND